MVACWVAGPRQDRAHDSARAATLSGSCSPRLPGKRSSRVRLMVSRRVRQPFAFVLGRPVIVLPENLCGDDQGAAMVAGPRVDAY